MIALKELILSLFTESIKKAILKCFNILITKPETEIKQEYHVEKRIIVETL